MQKSLIAAAAFAAWILVPQAAAQQMPQGVLGGFIENVGQYPAEARFASRLSRSFTYVTDDGLRVVSPDVRGTEATALFLTFEGARTAEVIGEKTRPGRFHFYRGGDASAWRTDVRAFDSVRLRGVWRGVDVLVGERGGRAAYDLELSPGARLADVVVRLDGAESLTISPDGSLSAGTSAGPFRQTEPVAWRTGPDGRRHPVRCAFRLIDDRRFGFVSDDETDQDLPLTIDPSLDWCGFLGGNNFDEIFAIDVDAAGNAFYGGRSASGNFPFVPGSFDLSQTGGNFDGIVVKLDPTASTLLYGTFLGGSGTDRVEALRVNAAGEAYLCGQGGSGWPTTVGAYDVVYGGQGDMYAAKLSSDGAQLIYSTYIGGSGEERGHAIAIDASGAAYIAGQTLSLSSYPSTPGSISPTADAPNTWNACVTKVQPGGASIGYSFRFGGGASDWAYAVEVDSLGAAYVTGATSSLNFPIAGGGLSSPDSSLDVFVTKINPNGQNYAWSSRFGGAGVDQAFGTALGTDGSLYVVGAAATGFPTTVGALRTTGDGGDAFAFRIAANGQSLLYSTYLGGTSTEQANGAALDASGRLYVVGYTNSLDFPTPGGLQTVSAGGGAQAEGFVAKLSAAGDALQYGSYFGGSSDDNITCARLAGNGLLWVGGSTLSVEVATGNGAGIAPGGAYDGFGARMTLPKSAGATPFAVGMPYGAGTATLECEQPVFDFEPIASGINAPANALGLIFLGPEIAPIDFGGGTLVYGDPDTVLLFAATTSDAGGAWSVQLPGVPTVPALEGVTFALQAGFLGGGPLGIVMTNPLRYTLGY